MNSILTRIGLDQTGNLRVLTSDQQFILVGAVLFQDGQPGARDRNGDGPIVGFPGMTSNVFVLVARDGKADLLHTDRESNAIARTEICVPPGDKIRYAQVIGEVGEGEDLLLDVQTVAADETHGRYLQRYGRNGALRSSTRIPWSSFATVSRDLVAMSTGDVIQLLPLPLRVKLLLWSSSPAVNTEVDDSGDIDRIIMEARDEKHSLSEIQGDSQPDYGDLQMSSTTQEPKILTSISRAEVMLRAMAYANHLFTVTAGNLTPISWCPISPSKYVKTPSWLSPPGSNKVGVPYKWGGFSGLAGTTSYTEATGLFFDGGLAEGKFAGDTCTNSDPDCAGIGTGSDCAVGVDCSGFVSQTWGLQSHYSTGSLASISISISFGNLQQGDILLWSGHHVLLFDSFAANGGVNVYESVGAAWKVKYSSYSSVGLANYLPYQYSQIIGGTPPSNDNCSSAELLISNVSCNYTSGSVLNATASGLPKPPCDPYSNPNMFDVWYGFTAVASSHIVTVVPLTSIGDPVVSVYSGCSSSPVSCSDNGGQGAAETLPLTGLTVGNTYYVRIYDYGSVEPTGSNANFQICVTASAAPPGAFNKSNPANGATGQPTSVTLSWGASSNATSYEACVDSTNDNACSGWSSVGTALSASLDGLSPNTTYYWQVRANNGAGTTYADGSSTAHWSFTTQGATCVFSISPMSASGAGGGGAGSIQVTGSPSGCSGSWGSGSNASWLTLTGTTSGSGSGDWTVPYSYSANPSTTSERAGTVTFLGAFPWGGTFTLTQSPSSIPSCTFAISPMSASGAGGGGAGSIQVTGSPSGCSGSWGSGSNASWLTLTGTTSGSGSGNWTVPYSYPANPSTTSDRTGTVTFFGAFPWGGTFVNPRPYPS